MAFEVFESPFEHDPDMTCPRCNGGEVLLIEEGVWVCDDHPKKASA